MEHVARFATVIVESDLNVEKMSVSSTESTSLLQSNFYNCELIPLGELKAVSYYCTVYLCKKY